MERLTILNGSDMVRITDALEVIDVETGSLINKTDSKSQLEQLRIIGSALNTIYKILEIHEYED